MRPLPLKLRKNRFHAKARSRKEEPVCFHGAVIDERTTALDSKGKYVGRGVYCWGGDGCRGAERHCRQLRLKGGDYRRGRYLRGLLRLHEIAETLGLAFGGVGFAVRAAMMFLRGQEKLRAGETVSPEQRRYYQHRHERIECSPHLDSIIHEFRVSLADFLHICRRVIMKPGAFGTLCGPTM